MCGSDTDVGVFLGHVALCPLLCSPPSPQQRQLTRWRHVRLEADVELHVPVTRWDDTGELQRAPTRSRGGESKAGASGR